MTVKATANVMPSTAQSKVLPGPGKDLFQMVRGGLIARGTSVKGWAETSGYSENAVRYALYGMSDTDESKRIRGEVMRAAGLLTESAKD